MHSLQQLGQCFLGGSSPKIINIAVGAQFQVSAVVSCTVNKMVLNFVQIFSIIFNRELTLP